MNHLEIVLLDVDGFGRTYLMASAAVYAAVLLYVGCTFTDADSLGGTGFQTSHTAYAFLIVDFECVYEHVLIIGLCVGVFCGLD
jgi:tRNA G26 N,N-dimethylase Trm1